MFKVNRVRVQLFTGMWLKEIDEFDMRVNSPTTIIIGRNGCGKSRLLGVIYPVCPAKTDFRDGGSYLNESEIDGVNYKFYCKRIGNSMKCTIKNVDTNAYIVKNVNPKVYNAKVSDLLDIDPALVNLLIGIDDTELCRLSTGQRRHWFTRLSVSDLSYPLAVHKRLKDYGRDLVGAIKHGQMKIADIKPRVVDCEEERLQLHARIDGMRIEVEELTKEISGIVTDQTITKGHYINTLNELEGVSRNILKFKTGSMFDLHDIDEKIAAQRITVGESRVRCQTSQKSLGDLLAKKQRIEYQLRNSTGLISQIDDLTTWVSDKLGEPHAFARLYNYRVGMGAELQTAFNYLNEFSTDLTRAIDSINGEVTFNGLESELDNLNKKIAETDEKLRRVDNALNDKRHRLEHFLSVDDVDCPKCTTRFKPGLESLDVGAARSEINDLETIRNKGEAFLLKIKTEASDVHLNLGHVSKVRAIVIEYSKNPILSIMFEHLHSEDALYINRGKFGGIVSWFVKELTDSMEVYVEWDKLETKRSQLADIKAESNIDDSCLDDDIVHVEKVTLFQQDALSLAESTLKTLESQRKNVIEMGVLTDRFNILVARVNTEESVWMTNEYRDLLTTHRKELFDSYSIANSRFNEMDEEYRRLQAIEEDVDSLQRRQAVTTLLVRAMSPEKGLLRKHFYKAIARITDMMNKHIDAVWQYHLKVLPCNIDDNDLDYKFPFMVGDNDEPADDVKCGSAAQREIFNLVFRLTAYRALGLEGFPLILDEPGHTFDEGHRDELVDFIKRLLGSSEHSQAFIVSHNSDVHSRLSGADFVVISEDGVTPPAVYNEYTKIIMRG